MNESLDLQPGEVSWASVDACTLPTTERPVRVAEFDDLFDASLTAVRREGPDRLRLELSGTERLKKRVQDLADRETACCSFFDFSVTAPDASTVVLDVAVPRNRSDVLAALADRAETHLRRRGDQ
jgi:hypothetical protein